MIGVAAKRLMVILEELQRATPQLIYANRATTKGTLYKLGLYEIAETTMLSYLQFALS